MVDRCDAVEDDEPAGLLALVLRWGALAQPAATVDKRTVAEATAARHFTTWRPPFLIDVRRRREVPLRAVRPHSAVATSFSAVVPCAVVFALRHPDVVHGLVLGNADRATPPLTTVGWRQPPAFPPNGHEKSPGSGCAGSPRMSTWGTGCRRSPVRYWCCVAAGSGRCSAASRRSGTSGCCLTARSWCLRMPGTFFGSQTSQTSCIRWRTPSLRWMLLPPPGCEDACRL